MKKQKNPQWYLGFFALFAFAAFPGILQGEWGQAVWLVWLVWGIYFFKQPETDSTTKDTGAAPGTEKPVKKSDDSAAKHSD